MKNNRTEHSLLYTADQIDTIARMLAQQLTMSKVMTFTGSLGVGKTTLIRSLLRIYGITQGVTSPTFTYLNVYQNDQGQFFYHFDLYRLKTVDEFLMQGFGEYLYQPNSWVFIEWPAIIMPLLTHDVCHVTIELGIHEQERRLQIVCI